MCAFAKSIAPSLACPQLGYFSRDDLPEPMGLGVRTRIIDALDGVTEMFRVIPEAAAVTIEGR
jgi:hypothetical protein